MSELSKMFEVAEATEYFEVANKVWEAVGAGEDLQLAVAEAAEKIQGYIEDGIAPLGELAEKISECSNVFMESLGSFAEQLHSFYERTIEALGQGLEWLRENPEMFKAGVELCTMVFASIENPAGVLDYLEKNSGALEEITRSYAPLLGFET
jgi:hypothetical protein